MITLEKIISSNLEMLKAQEAELLKSLTFVQKAKQLFQAQGGDSPVRRRRRRGGAVVSTATAGSKPQKIRTRRSKALRGSRMDEIMSVLKQRNGKATSGEVIQTLFKQQSKLKDLNHFRQLIYPVLTRAYKTGTLKQKDGNIVMP